jgi:hypothetical protein
MAIEPTSAELLKVNAKVVGEELVLPTLVELKVPPDADSSDTVSK